VTNIPTGPRSGRPTGGPTQPTAHAPHAALLIDFDNVTLGIRSDLTKELRTLLGSAIIKGKVAVQRAYADWRRYPQYIVPLSESSIDLIFAPAFGTNKKNATDIRLAVDAIELVFTRPEIGTFILLSGDSDFSSLVIKLKEYGKYVIGVGIRESASDLLIQNCDEYFSYSDLAGLTREVDVPSVQRDPWELVVEAVDQMARNGDVMRSDRLKQVMQQIDPNFDEKNAGFNRFSKFITEVGNRGLVRVSKLENGQYEVGPIAADGPGSRRKEREPEKAAAPSRRAEAGKPRGRTKPAPREEPAAPPPREGREEPRRGRRGRGRGGAASAEAPRRTEGPLTLAESFQLMQQALDELRTPVSHEQLRARMLALRGREDPLLEPARFLRLLRQAHDAEVADVKKTGEDTYEVTPRGVRPAAAQQRAPEPREQPKEAAAAAPTAAPPTEGGRIAALRFRRGSRGLTRSAEVPLVGAVVLPIEGDGAGPSPAPQSPGKSPAARPAQRRSPKRSAAKRASTKATAKAAPEAPADSAPKQEARKQAAKQQRARGSRRKAPAKEAPTE
jgi:uncharacterized protein (TIGR00288 family)